MKTNTPIDTSHDAKLPLCKGCRDAYYNQPGNTTCGRCWSLASAQVVTLYRLGWWTQPIERGAYRKVVTLSCHRAPGQYAQHESMPTCFPGKSRVENEPAYDARDRHPAPVAGERT